MGKKPNFMKKKSFCGKKFILWEKNPNFMKKTTSFYDKNPRFIGEKPSNFMVK